MDNIKTKKEGNSLLVSYITLRRAIGYIGIFLPIFLIMGSLLVGNCHAIQSSISIYYHTVMRDGFVGVISSISFFLFCYTGYDVRDLITTRLAGIFAIFVAFFPTDFDGVPQEGRHYVVAMDNPLVPYVHLTFAALFFIALAYMPLFLFTETDKKGVGINKAKLRRNKVYRICGYTMLASIFAIALYFIWLDGIFPELGKYRPVFWLESMALIAFGISWLTKGETIFPDESAQYA